MTTSSSDRDPFERDIRVALEAEASDPAPERLVARIARSRAEARPPSSGPAGRLARLAPRLRTFAPLGVGLAAVLIVVAAGGTLLRQPGTGSTTPAPGASTAPTATEPPATPVTPAPSNPVLITPSPDASADASETIPADFQPVSVTFVSASHGWVLGEATCDGTRCWVVARTTDGGQTWTRIAAPDATILTLGTSLSSGIRALRFASDLDGWAFGPELWVTHDGGATWRQEALPGGDTAAEVLAVEAAAGTVHVAYVARDSADVAIASGSTGGDTLRLDPTTVMVGAGPVPFTQIVLHGASGWLLQVNRDVVAGAQLAAGGWQAWNPPCLDTAGPAFLAASSASDLVAACEIGVWSTPQGVHLFTSTDGGATFAPQPVLVPITNANAIAAPPGLPTVVIGGDQPDGKGSLIATFDGGQTWTTVDTLAGPGSLSELGFTTATQGVAIAKASDGTSRLLMTRDGGRTWAAVAFAAG